MSPVLIVVAVTGGLYVFKVELERLIYPGLMFATAGEERVSYELQFAAASKAAPPGFVARVMSVAPDLDRATRFSFTGKDESFLDIFVDPYRGKVLGILEDGGIFDLVLEIHRTLFVGSTGRVIVELMTSWTIVLLVTGLYLWWPRGRKKAAGTLVPRLRGKPYVVLRDIHSVGGFYLLAIALTIVCTGLVYTIVWGAGYRYVARGTGAYDFFLNPPKTMSKPGAPPVLNFVVEAAQARFPGFWLTIPLKTRPGRSAVIFARAESGQAIRGALAVDLATGQVLAETRPSQTHWLAWWTTWNYPLHVGSILGTFTKVIWLLACLVLVALPITGVWMWWRRRPAGRSGFPRKVEAKIPAWLGTSIALLCVCLPVLGASLVLILAGEWSYLRLRPSPRRV